MLGRALLLALLLAGAAVSPSAAQTTAAGQGDPSEGLTVTALPPPAELRTEILRFVHGHARLSRIDQLARWREPVCPRVLNLPTEFGAFIVDRIEAVAREAGAPSPADGADCAPNVSIIFTAEPQAVLDGIRREEPAYLGFHFIGDRDRLATMTRPIQSWYATGTYVGGGMTTVDEPMTDPPAGVSGSRLTRGLESVFVHVLILVDANAVADAPIGPIADYLAVLSLTHIRDESWACGGLVTIMEHFSDCATVPQELTMPDRAFLRGLYTMDPVLVGTLQRAQVRGRMTREMRDGEDGADIPGQH
jgi:hypothetical protein